MTDSTSTASPRPGATRYWPLWVRCLVAAVGMLATAMTPALLLLLPVVRQALADTANGRWTTAAIAWTALDWSLPTLAALALLAVLARAQRARLRTLIAPRGAREFAVAVVVTVVIALVVAAAAGLAQLLPGTRPGSSPVAAQLAVAVGLGVEKAFLMQGIPEEWWFRGFAWRGARRAGWATLAATTLTFTVLHLISSGGQQTAVERLLYLVLPLGMGLCAGALRWCFGSTGAAIGVHGGTHTGNLVFLFFAWNQGVSVWLCSGFALILVAVAVLLWRRPWQATREPAASAEQPGILGP